MHRLRHRGKYLISIYPYRIGTQFTPPNLGNPTNLAITGCFFFSTTGLGSWASKTKRVLLIKTTQKTHVLWIILIKFFKYLQLKSFRWRCLLQLWKYHFEQHADLQACQLEGNAAPAIEPTVVPPGEFYKNSSAEPRKISVDVCQLFIRPLCKNLDTFHITWCVSYI